MTDTLAMKPQSTDAISSIRSFDRMRFSLILLTVIGFVGVGITGGFTLGSTPPTNVHSTN
ncbi:hypothetical protein [Bacillus clarus]|uniref:hypothetical protein n=1 Tax=Bacillus clarus TaxID=2338372 RepID=UPI00115C684A|nr:hypothetical protein [Bacillus clarus]